MTSGEVVTTSAGGLFSWARKHSLWPLPFGGGCCAATLAGALSPRYDLGRLGAEQIRIAPQQADLLIASGRFSLKMVPRLKRTYELMPEPKWVMAAGACACSGGAFDTYALVQGIDRCIPVDIFVPGCPPRPEDLIDGLVLLQKKIAGRGKM